jgi:hypothetical protein
MPLFRPAWTCVASSFPTAYAGDHSVTVGLR